MHRAGHKKVLFPMMASMRFPYADLLAQLEQSGGEHATEASSLSPSVERLLADAGESRAKAMASLILLLKARKATLQAAFDTTQVADELRRYQKFAKPGKPSAHIVQLRQSQAAARQATNVARQSLIKAASAFVRDAGIEVAPRTPLDEFITRWIEANLPKDEA